MGFLLSHADFLPQIFSDESSHWTFFSVDIKINGFSLLYLLSNNQELDKNFEPPEHLKKPARIIKKRENNLRKCQKPVCIQHVKHFLCRERESSYESAKNRKKIPRVLYVKL